MSESKYKLNDRVKFSHELHEKERNIEGIVYYVGYDPSASQYYYQIIDSRSGPDGVFPWTRWEDEIEPMPAYGTKLWEVMND